MIPASIYKLLARLTGHHNDSSRSQKVKFPWRKQRERRLKVGKPHGVPSCRRVSSAPAPLEILLTVEHEQLLMASAPREVLTVQNYARALEPPRPRDVLMIAEYKQPLEPPSTHLALFTPSMPREVFTTVDNTQASDRLASSTSSLPRKTFSLGDQQPSIPPTHLTLLGLPAEIRVQIFDYVMGGHVLHIFSRQQRVRYIKCDLDVSATFDSIYSSCPAGYQRRSDCIYDHFDDAGDPTFTADINLLALVKTCRQVYLECIHSLYTANIFDVKDPLTLMSFEQLLVPTRLVDIRVLQLTWDTAYFPTDADYYPLESWLDAELFEELEAPKNGICVNSFSFWLWACKVIVTKMSGLRVLSIQLEFLQKRKFCRGKGHLERILRPLRACTGLDTFEVVVTPARGPSDMWGELDGLVQDIREVACRKPVT